jgi:aromatic amino acid transport protein AroP
MAGPSVLLGYGMAGIIAFFIMRQLGEMVVDEPVAGSFSYFADKYCGQWAGFMSGWNYWVLYVLVSMAELSAVGIYVQYWWPAIPTWVSALASSSSSTPSACPTSRPSAKWNSGSPSSRWSPSSA